MPPQQNHNAASYPSREDIRVCTSTCSIIPCVTDATLVSEQRSVLCHHHHHYHHHRRRYYPCSIHDGHDRYFKFYTFVLFRYPQSLYVGSFLCLAVDVLRLP